MDGQIEVTGVDLVKLVKEVYALSRPQGLGYLHFKPEPLSDEEANAILKRGNMYTPVSMDYVNGRACKFHVTRGLDEKLFTDDKWYDHSDADLAELLKRVGVQS